MSVQKTFGTFLVILVAALFRKKFFCGFSSVALLAAGLCFLSVTSVQAYIRLPSVLNSNMVLQRDIPLKIWGKAEENEKIKVSFCGQNLETIADKDGFWQVVLKPVKAGGPFEMTVAGSVSEDPKVLVNILVGDVWVCSGQSNMAFDVQNCLNPKEEIENANYSEIRFFDSVRTVSKNEKWNLSGKWVACSPKTVKGFSAVAYFFGRELYKELKIPIGLINSSWGGTPAESWMSRKALESETDFLPILYWWEEKLEKYPAAKKIYEKQVKTWQALAQKEQSAGRPAPPPPPAPNGSSTDPWMPSGLYNSMIYPITNFGIKGAIWYQGESNADRSYQYRKLFPALITDWRKAWGQGDFPFFFVQLAGFGLGGSLWGELREAQLMTLSLPKTGMAVAIDIGDRTDIHPKNKQEVGRRLALNALKVAYNKDIVYSGPIYDKMVVEGKKIRIYFKNVGSGLSVGQGDDELIGFKVGNSKHRFSTANAVIEKNTVVVWSDDIDDPIAVRYGWADLPKCNLYNKEGLPASPFRTDDFQGLTYNRLRVY